MVEFMQIATGVLAVAAALGALVVVIGSTVGPDFLRHAADWLLERRLLFTMGIGVVATLGSLYFSELGANYAPCRWCWFQRTMMYPIGVIGIVAYLRRDHNSRPYFIALSAIGAAMSLWHNYLEIVPQEDTSACEYFGPACDVVYFRTFGVFSLASMALIGFVSVLVLNVFRATQPRDAVK